MSAEVMVVARDLSGGTAGSSGSLFNISSSTKGKTPKSLDHVGVIVHSVLFEFGPGGVRITHNPASNSQEKWRFYPVGSTSKSEAEVLKWADVQTSKPYSGSCYDISDHNCICFSEDLCKYLGVTLPQDIVELKKWVKENKHFCELCKKLAP